MKFTVKFFSNLMEYLPADTQGNSLELVENTAPSPREIMRRLKVPEAEVRTMMVNGAFLPEEERDSPLREGDVLAVWPAIQGG